MSSLNDWLTNDPDPMKTLDLVKKKIAWKKKMSSENPVALMRAVMTKEEFDNYWEQKKIMEADFLLNKGFSVDKTLKISWYVPQKVVSETQNTGIISL